MNLPTGAKLIEVTVLHIILVKILLNMHNSMKKLYLKRLAMACLYVCM